MAGGNADRVRLVFDLLSRRDIDAVLDELSPDCVIDWTRSLSEMNGVYSGRDAIRSLWGSIWVEPWEWVEWTVNEATETGPDRVLCVSDVRMRGRGSGAEVEAQAATLWTLADGKVARVALYQSREDALGDASEG